MIIFSSLDFLFFFILIFCTYWVAPKKIKNSILLLGSYIFYASWSFKFLGLIFISTITDYLCGLWIYNAKEKKTKKLLLLLSVGVNLGLLGFFKYFNFFIDNVANLLTVLGFSVNISLLSIILPVGISFYTFQTMSYTIDIYRGKMKPTKNIVTFALFVAYFPQLVAGPIERARDLIPRIEKSKKFRNIDFRKGFYLFIYGLVKKVAISDSLTGLVDNIYSSTDVTATMVIIGTLAFAIQIYCDFSGYSNMARGISYFFGIRLSTNFNLPYFAKTPSQFWKRWHITLSSWVRDYIYIPLGGRKAPFFGISSLITTMFLIGLWHGAAWNFILWGIYWAVLTLLYRFMYWIYTRLNIFNISPKLLNIISVLIMFVLTCYSWILFRSASFDQIIAFSRALFSGIDFYHFLNYSYFNVYIFGSFLILYMLLQAYHKDLLFITKKNFTWQSMFYLTLFFLYIQAGPIVSFPFIYFQF